MTMSVQFTSTLSTRAEDKRVATLEKPHYCRAQAIAGHPRRVANPGVPGRH